MQWQEQVVHRSVGVMSSRYRVDYHIKEHRRDEFIQWIKALLAVPFVIGQDSAGAQGRYLDILLEVEKLVVEHMQSGRNGTSRLGQLVPTVGTFFTPLPLRDAFLVQDGRRSISKRRLVAPSFNDIRLVLNTAQILHFRESGSLKLVTFDGDITLYEDGGSVVATSPLVDPLVRILGQGIAIGVVTAAGYSTAAKYYERLHGLVDAVASSSLAAEHKENLLVMGGEASFLFRYSTHARELQIQPRSTWMLPAMLAWRREDVDALLDFAQAVFRTLLAELEIDAVVVRKERAVGVVPGKAPLLREQLEEVVLQVDRRLKSSFTTDVSWCAFNGGSDVWVDIGDKSLGVRVLQRFLGNTPQNGRILPENTLHIGDQFCSLGSNDYASRTAAATAWVADPSETLGLLNDLLL